MLFQVLLCSHAVVVTLFRRTLVVSYTSALEFLQIRGMICSFYKKSFSLLYAARQVVCLYFKRSAIVAQPDIAFSGGPNKKQVGHINNIEIKFHCKFQCKFHSCFNRYISKYQKRTENYNKKTKYTKLRQQSVNITWPLSDTQGFK